MNSCRSVYESFVLICFLFINFQQGLSSHLCPYHDAFSSIKYISCSTGCCGDYHTAFCCIHSHFRDIAAGSIGGLVLLVGLICLTVCCFRNIQQRPAVNSLRSSQEGARVYGTISNTSTPVKQETPDIAAGEENPNVLLTVTPPTPTQLGQEDIYNQPP